MGFVGLIPVPVTPALAARMTGHWEPGEKTGHTSGPGLPLGASGVQCGILGSARMRFPEEDWDCQGSPARGGVQGEGELMHPGVVTVGGSST